MSVFGGFCCRKVFDGWFSVAIVVAEGCAVFGIGRHTTHT